MNHRFPRVPPQNIPSSQFWLRMKPTHEKLCVLFTEQCKDYLQSSAAQWCLQPFHAWRLLEQVSSDIEAAGGAGKDQWAATSFSFQYLDKYILHPARGNSQWTTARISKLWIEAVGSQSSASSNKCIYCDCSSRFEDNLRYHLEAWRWDKSSHLRMQSKA